MKAISLWQPWASLMAAGKKRVETRGWPLRYRGPLLIHAAQAWSKELSAVSKSEPFRTALAGVGGLGVMWSDKGRPSLPFGAIVGRVDVVDCYPTAMTDDAMPGSSADMPPMQITLGDFRKLLRLGRNERAFGDYSPGRFAILCENAVMFDKPIFHRGMQGLFDVPESVVAEGRS